MIKDIKFLNQEGESCSVLPGSVISVIRRKQKGEPPIRDWTEIGLSNGNVILTDEEEAPVLKKLNWI